MPTWRDSTSSGVHGRPAAGDRPARGRECFYAKGRVWAKFAQVAHRTLPALGGVSVVRESIPMPADLEVAALALVHAWIWRASEIEFRRDAGGHPLLMEINARLSGSLEIAVRSGVAFPELLWRWAADEPLATVPGYRTGIKMRYLIGDAVALGEPPHPRPKTELLTTQERTRDLREGHSPPSELRYIDRTDLAPAFVALARDVRRARRDSSRAKRVGIAGHRNDRTPTGTTVSSTDIAVIGAGPNGLSVEPICNMRDSNTACSAVPWVHGGSTCPPECSSSLSRMHPTCLRRVRASWPATTAPRQRRSTTRESSPCRVNSSSTTAAGSPSSSFRGRGDRGRSLTRVHTGGFMLRTATGGSHKSGPRRRGHRCHAVRVRAA